ncbi:hypothetical protein T11_1044 [Trichinella zimbabwensis]|uniref:Uncharacterized protein n=1 Tax=Trichinella zimbabwensis TaxID=268475 RepID=A0A0V1GBI7_9BILA|nr:hypothetical protein T11_1044 [Trichinella zimbabwensis]
MKYSAATMILINGSCGTLEVLKAAYCTFRVILKSCISRGVECV